MKYFDYDKNDLKENIVYYIFDEDSHIYFACEYDKKNDCFIPIQDRISDVAREYNLVKEKYSIDSEFILSVDIYKKEKPTYKIK